MEKLIYYIKKTFRKNKQCKGCCVVCKYYDVCKSEE